MDIPPIANLAFELSSYAIAIVIFAKVAREDRFQIFLFLTAIVATVSAELIGIRVSHGYYYTDFLIKIAGRPDGLPLCIALDWAVIIFCVWRLGARLDVKWYLLPLVFGALAVPLDLVLDPVASISKLVPHAFMDCHAGNFPPGEAIGLSYWVWCVSPANAHHWFGVPLGNFIGWFLLVAGFTLCALIAQRKLGHDASWPRIVLAGIGVVVGTLLLEFGSLWIFEQLEKLGISSAILLTGLLATGFGAILASGNRRTDRSFDVWSMTAFLGTLTCCTLAYFGSLRAVASQDFVFAMSSVLAVSVALSFWVMRGWPVSRSK
ncbi:MAG: putative membrane protein [Limisphaerales bacterium]|jgi:uncharacterized membrane protein